ncbi:hypothetical protein R3Q16_29810 [Rhodococcus globerulus]|uniref:Uncharacterized protein n=1 Tax=Rhodococcus globerulus TaxID=33008 RepID=A0ABU4C335_RHOGO|nr:hypothetical protein [Rhodococcus globerulus]MDV6270829.1 hypothetical protein [Rhodococcus globerulus]
MVFAAEERSGLGIGKVAKVLWRLPSATIAINGARHAFPPQVDADLKAGTGAGGGWGAAVARRWGCAEGSGGSIFGCF